MNSPALAGQHIVITRPLGQANRLETLIKQAGGVSILFPLLEITALTDYRFFDEKISQLNQFDWAIFISSNSVQSSLPRMINQIKKLPAHLKFAAIGPKTAAELTEFGIENILIPEARFDSEALLALPEMQDVSNKNIMIFRGIGGREVLADTLKQRGAKVDFAESYQRINPQQNLAPLADIAANQMLDAMVITSSEAMRYLLTMANDAAWLKNVKLCVNNARIAEQANKRGLALYVADAPGDDAMLSCLLKALKS